MASLTPAAVQNENLHIHRGKGVEGSKFGDIQNENLHILKGKAVDGTKSGKGVEGFKAEVSKPGKAGRQERKALTDLAQARKPVLSAANKATAIRETAKKASKSNFFTDEEISKCQERAEEGVEHMHFSGNDMLKFEADQQAESVWSEINEAMSGLPEWTDMTPVKEVTSDTEDTFQLKFEMVVLPPTPRASLARKPSYEEMLKLLELDYDDSIYFDWEIDDIKLKEEDEDDNAFI